MAVGCCSVGALLHRHFWCPELQSHRTGTRCHPTGISPPIASWASETLKWPSKSVKLPSTKSDREYTLAEGEFSFCWFLRGKKYKTSSFFSRKSVHGVWEEDGYRGAWCSVVICSCILRQIPPPAAPSLFLLPPNRSHFTDPAALPVKKVKTF